MRLRAIALLSGATLLAATQANALSCDARPDAAGKAICADATVKAADDRMSAAFEALRSTMAAPEATTLLDDQRDWLRRRNGTCDGSGEPAGACLRRWDDARARDLRGEAAAGPGAKGRLAPLLVRRPGDAKTMERQLFLFRFAVPATPGETAFNALVDRRVSETPADASVDPGGKGTYVERGSIAYASPDLISMEVDGSEFVTGAAHGMTWTNNLNVDLRSGKRLAASDVFDADGLGRLKTLCAAQVADQVKANYKTIGQDPGKGGENAAAFRDEVAGMRKDVDTVTGDPAHWRFGAEALTVTYDQDAVASHAEGSFTCVVPYATLRGFALPRAPLPDAKATP